MSLAILSRICYTHHTHCVVQKKYNYVIIYKIIYVSR